jgi:hypothetical protein
MIESIKAEFGGEIAALKATAESSDKLAAKQEADLAARRAKRRKNWRRGSPRPLWSSILGRAGPRATPT